VYAQSEALEIADVPRDPVAEPVCGGEIPLDRLYEGLQPGRWLIVSGERTDVAGAPPGNPTAGGVPVSGVPAVELAMLGGIRQEYDPGEPGAVTRSTLVLANPLAYCYRRDTMTIYGNVIGATHGETRNEVLGSGDAGQANQAFALKQKPLTYVAASTPTGSQSSLAGYVDGVRWREADSPVGLSPTDRAYVTKTDDEDVTTVVFGDGVEGARLPTGQENVTAVYRFGVGAAGNLRAGQLSLLASRPQGVSAVTNPVPATGGADREDRDQARRNAPLGVTSLDRVVSVQDYADFARTFAGIGKASAGRIADGRRSLVHLTIAGENDIPIDPISPLYRNLRAALAEFGDPYQPFQIDPRRLLLLVIEAKVRLDADRRWEERAPVIRQAVFDRFAFARRDLGQDVSRGEVIAAIQSVPGVSYVDLDLLDTVDEQQVIDELTAASPGAIGASLTLRHRIRAHLARVNPAPPPQIIPAELVVLRSSVPDTLAITEIPA
jgi:predicted phage baseplate assembly protein